MKIVSNLLIPSALALAMALAPAAALAGNSGNHGNSAGHSNAGGNSANAGANANVNANVNAGGGGGGSENIASLAGAGNAAHASVQGLMHANPHSAVGRVKAYADLNLKAQASDTATATALSDCNTAVSGDTGITGLSGDCSTLTVDDLTAAGAAPETVDALTAYLDATAASATDDANAQAALAAVTKNSTNPAVKAYIDKLLAKYYAAN